MEIGALIRRAGVNFGDAPCITEDDRTLSFREFDQATDRVGNALSAIGLRPGDRVGVLLPNTIDCLVAYYALAKAGLVRVQLNAREAVTDHEHKLSEGGARAIIQSGFPDLTADFQINLEQLRDMISTGDPSPCQIERPLDAPLRFAFTGGTTGKAKAVNLTTRCELMEISALLTDLIPDLRQGDTFLHAAPISHASGAFFLPCICRGAHSLVMQKFNTSDFLDLAERSGASMTFLVPTMLAMIMEDPKVDSCKDQFRRIVYGASSISSGLVERLEQRFGRVLAQTYGQAENPMAITQLAPEHHDRVGSCGRPYTMVDVAIFDENDQPLPPNERGEIVCRGVQLMAGYWNRPEKTAEAIRDGWLRTGDIGYMDEDGFYYIVDRKNDMFISGGFNIYPSEVEDVLLRFPGVVEAAVVGLPDERWGERVVAVVAGRPDLEVEAILLHAQTHLSGYKRPRALEIWPELPKSGANKIMRRRVKETLMER